MTTAGAPTPSDPAEPVHEDRSRRDDLGDFIREQREAAKLSLRHLSKLAGVSNPYLSQIERGLRNPSAEILQAIAKALEISSETLYVRAGILEERPDGGGVESAIARDPHLTELHRSTLLEMYRTFVRVHAMDAPGPGSRARPKVVGRVIDSLQTGQVDDAAVRAAAAPEEDPDEA